MVCLLLKTKPNGLIVTVVSINRNKIKGDGYEKNVEKQKRLHPD
jgi:hypothetical protein